MKTTKTFKAATPFTEVEAWVEGTLVELLGDSAPTLLSAVRLTIEIVKAHELIIDPIIDLFEVQDAREQVLKFVEFRRDELRKPVTVEGLRRLLRPFAGRPAELRVSIAESIRQGWKGLFEPKGSSAGASRDFAKKGGPSGGTW